MSSYKELRLLGQMIDSGQTNREEPQSQPTRVVGFSAPTSSDDSHTPTPSIAIPGRASASSYGASPTLAWSASPADDKRLSGSLPTSDKSEGSPMSQGIKITREPIKRQSSLSSSLSSSGLSELSSSLENSKILSTMVISSAGASSSTPTLNNRPSPTSVSPSSMAITPPMPPRAQPQQQQEKREQQGRQQQKDQQDNKKEQQPKREKQQQQPKQQQEKKEQQPKQQQEKKEQQQQQGGGKEQQPKREKQQQQPKQQQQQQGQPSQKQQSTPREKRGEDEGGKDKGQGQRKGQQQPHAHPTFQYDDPKRRVQAEKKKIVQQTPVDSSHQVPLFSHLPQYERASSLSTKLGFAGSDVHPSILQLGIMYSNFKIAGSNARAVAMLTAFKQVITDFETPPSKTFHRELDIKLKPQIQFLIDCRPMSISMGNAINFLKQQMTQTVNMDEEQAKLFLLERIDSFIQERIVLADQAIATFGVSKITHNDVILTFARSHVVEMIIKKAFDEGKKFRVVVVDSRPKFEGKALLTSLTQHGVPCNYIMLNGISYIMKEVTKVFLGAYSLLSNGGLVSRVGTAVVATMAHSYNVPVMVCCETYKFTERVHLDSICFNQLGDPDELPATADLTSNATPHVQPKDKDFPQPTSLAIKDWRTCENLKLLNLLYDLTPMQYIIMVITEVGMIPPTSVPVILREYRKEPML